MPNRIGYVPALYCSGVCYSFGEGVAQDTKQAARYFRAAARKGDAKAEYNLGYYYEHGKGVSKNKKSAMRWYEHAAEHGDVEAKYKLGGFLLLKHDARAFQWFKQASNAGHKDAKYNLALCYLEGIGVPANELKAKQLLRQLARLGDCGAKELLVDLEAT